MKKNKKMIAPNECSLLRWILALVAGYLAGTLLMIPLVAVTMLFPEVGQASFAGISMEVIITMLQFACLFLATVAALKWIAKTSLKDFVLGVGGSANKKQCLILAGLQAVGILGFSLFFIHNIELRGVEAGDFAVLVIFMLLVAWMQTSWEELVFRGLFLRWACKNNIRPTKKAVIAGVVSSIAFALVHMSNPEISSLTGIERVLGIVVYMIPAVAFYVADLYFGNLLPGMVLHWANNFLLFTVITVDVSAVSVPTLLVDHTEQTVGLMFVSTLFAYVPAMLYILWDYRKRKMAADSKV